MSRTALLPSPFALLGALARIARHEDVNFLVTNRIPRRLAAKVVARLGRVEHPALVRMLLRVWTQFGGALDLSDADTQHFPSMHAVFTRRLRAGARPLDADPQVLVSPCDALVGAMGDIEGTTVYQAKGFPYRLEDLLPDPALVERHRGGKFVTLRLTSTMYHRFHAPCDGRVGAVRYISGDTWNVNPISLRRIERLFCRNERVVLDVALGRPHAAVTLVPVAAVLVASMVLQGLPVTLDPDYAGPTTLAWNRAFAKGDELGHFQHGSTILVFATGGFAFAPGVREGAMLRMGQPLFRHPHHQFSVVPRTEVA